MYPMERTQEKRVSSHWVYYINRIPLKTSAKTSPSSVHLLPYQQICLSIFTFQCLPKSYIFFCQNPTKNIDIYTIYTQQKNAYWRHTSGGKFLKALPGSFKNFPLTQRTKFAKNTQLLVVYPKTTIIYSITNSPASLQFYIKYGAERNVVVAAVAWSREVVAKVSWIVRTIVAVTAGP